MNELVLVNSLDYLLKDINYVSIAIASAFFAAISNLLIKDIIKTVNSKDILGINFLIMGITLLVLSPFFFYFKVSFLSVSILISIAIIDAFANYYYFKAFEKSEVSIVTPLLALAPAFTFIFGWFFISDKATVLEFFLALSIMIIIIIFSTNFSKLKNFSQTTLIPALISSLLFGFSAIPSKYLLNIDAINAFTLYEIRALLIALMAFYIFGLGTKVLKKSIIVNYLLEDYL